MQSEELRAAIEEALRYFVTLPIRAPGAGAAFLEIPAPNGEVMEFLERDGDVQMRFGASGQVYGFASEIQADDDAAAREAYFKGCLKDLIKDVTDIIQERVFTAYYKKLFIPLSEFYPAADFEKMKGLKEFRSVSWTGKYSYGNPPA